MIVPNYFVLLIKNINLFLSFIILNYRKYEILSIQNQKTHKKKKKKKKIV
jgi:hypothetical protein